MALVQFKRIIPVPPPSPEDRERIHRMMLNYIIAHPEEWDELFEPEAPIPDPIPDESEFIEGLCPECGPKNHPLMPDGSPFRYMYHRGGKCRRFLKNWKYRDIRNGVLIPR